jgi:hypothetical protein
MATTQRLGGYEITNVTNQVAGKYFDRPTLLAQLNGDIKHYGTFLGYVQALNQMTLRSTPIFDFASASTIFVPWMETEIRYKNRYDLPKLRIRAEHTGDEDRGADKDVFQLEIGDGSAFGRLDVGHSFKTKMYGGGQEYRVVTKGGKVGAGFLYGVQLVTNDRKEVVDKSQIKPGLAIVLTDAPIGMYDESAPGIASGYGEQTLGLRLGSRRALNVKLHASAQGVRIDKMTGDKTGEISSYIEGKLRTKGNPIQQFNGATGAFSSYVENLMTSELLRLQEMALQFGNDGNFDDQNGYNNVKSAGLIPLLESGSMIDVTNWGLGDLRNIGLTFGGNRPDIDPRVRRFKIKGGRGMQMMIFDTMNKYAGSLIQLSGLRTNTDKIGVVSGTDPLNLKVGMQFTEFFLNDVGWFEVEYLPALDVNYGIGANQFAGRYPDSSYMALVFDVTSTDFTNVFEMSKNVKYNEGFNQNQNIYLIKDETLPGVKTSVKNGRTSPYAIKQGNNNIVSTLFDGCEIFTETSATLSVADATRALIARPTLIG